MKFISPQGFGTGFFTMFADRLYFVTADHVVEDFGNYKGRVAKIAGKALNMDALAFEPDIHRDFSHARISDEDLAKVGLAYVLHLDLKRKLKELKSNHPMLADCPDGLRPKLKRKVLSLCLPI